MIRSDREKARRTSRVNKYKKNNDTDRRNKFPKFQNQISLKKYPQTRRKFSFSSAQSYVYLELFKTGKFRCNPYTSVQCYWLPRHTQQYKHVHTHWIYLRGVKYFMSALMTDPVTESAKTLVVFQSENNPFIGRFIRLMRPSYWSEWPQKEI